MSMNMPSFVSLFMVAHKTLAKMLGIPYALFQNGLPVILPSSGSIANNGAITLTTALPNIYANCYLYLPANAISAGSAAGLYFAQMSSTTVGTVYNNTYTSGEPAIPASPTAFVTTGPGAYTQTTASDIVLLSFTLPGGALGKNGSLLIYPNLEMLTSATSKRLILKMGATAVITQGYTTSIHSNIAYMFKNKGAQNRNVNTSVIGFASSGSTAATHTTIDTSADVTIVAASQLVSAATDFLVINGITFQLMPSN